MIAAIMSSNNENLKAAIAKTFGITKTKHRDIETAFTMMLRSPFDESHKASLVHAINTYNADEMESKLKLLEEGFKKNSGLEKTH